MNRTVFHSTLGHLLAWVSILMMLFSTACGDDGGATPEPPTPPVVEEEVVISVEQTDASWEDVEIAFSIQGADRYYAGVETKATFSLDQILVGVATESFESFTQPTYEGSITAFPKENGLIVKPETTYVVWVVAYNEESYAKEDIFTCEVNSTADDREPEVTIEQLSATFNDIQIKVEMSATESYYAGYELTSLFSVEETLLYANEGAYSAYTKNTYEGSIRNFPAIGYLEILPSTSYTVWVLPINESGQMSPDELFTQEVCSATLEAGSSITVTAGEPIITPTSIELQLSAENAALLYYGYCTLSEATGMLDNESRLNWLFSQGEMVTGSAVSLLAEGLLDDTNYIVMALAVDGDGKYGSIFYKSYRTQKLPFNDLVVTINENSLSVDESSASLSWSLSGGQANEYLYYCGRTDYTYWNTTLGGDVLTAQTYMSLNPDDEHFQTTATKSVTLRNLKPGAEYVFVVMAKDSEGLYSMADSFVFTTSGTSKRFIARYNEDGSENSDWLAVNQPVVTFGNCFVKASIYRIIWKVAPIEGFKVYTVVSSPLFVDTFYGSPQEWAEKIVDGGDDLGVVYYCDVDGNNDRKLVESSEVVDGEQYYIYPYGTSDYLIYLVVEDAEGNLYEASTVQLPELEEEE